MESRPNLVYLSGIAYDRSISERKISVRKYPAYAEHLDVVENVIVEREIVAGDDIDASVFLDLPVL